MAALEEQVVEEPYPGWLRIEREGDKPYYKSPFPRTVLRNASMLKNYLSKEQNAGRMQDIEVEKFSFKRKYGLKKKALEVSKHILEVENDATVSEHVINDNEEVDMSEHRSVVQLLTRDPEKVINHRKLLSHAAKLIDKSRIIQLNHKPIEFDKLKQKLSDAADMKDIVNSLAEDSEGIEALRASFSDVCLTEISRIDSNCPLMEFPPSVNENIYCKIVEYGMNACPQLLSLVINLVVRKEDPVLPSDVLKVATVFSTLCYSTNQNIDAMVKLRSVLLQVDGLSNCGLDILSDCGLAQCSRSLSNHRDLFAEVGRSVMENTAANFPYQSILDNCDLQQQHLTVEVVEKETIDTSHLSTVKKSKEEALALFSKEQVLLGTEQNKDERDHLLYVVGIEVGKILAANRPNAEKLKKYLPSHHLHQNSAVKQTPAVTFVLKPYPYQE